MRTQTDPDTAALEDLDRDECLKLVATMSVGRIAVADDGDGPLVVPVNYVMDDDVVVFRTGAGSKLHAMRGNKPVSFQVDLIDPFHHTGWSVLIRGLAYGAFEHDVAHLDLSTWAPGDKHHWIRVLPTSMTGRRIGLNDGPWNAAAYL